MTTNAPPLGYEIVTADGHLLGEVKEVEDGRFKVDAPLRRDYWLANNAIVETQGTVLHLRFTLDDVTAAKQSDPAVDEEEEAE